MGKLYIVGIGPGSKEQRTIKAQEVLEKANVIIGYNTYLRLISDVLNGKKEVIGARMKEEIFRANTAIEKALEDNNNVALVSSGDPQIYGMAGLVFDIIAKKKIDLEVEVIPGVTAALAAAAKLGSPLSLDFVVISLSDLLIPADEILKKVTKASEGDFTIVFYNLINKKLLLQSMEIVSKHRKPDTPVGIVKSAYRDEEKVIITTLSSWKEHLEEIGMTTTMIIGNSLTYRYKNYMITPRGYERKYNL
ncbi:precorrin-3B C(17)-methyltransferase [Sulfolobus sp. A20]|uniref:precorrin-3B C(17)-methyltransferase n=1 Tax=Saccharolobus sp. A20 TaxID=1891280 RepID=UPI0008460370|nr:precorrin-3B C(17)-methyltransferase [Sulfolobus sp. A20]TRM75472.1 precorrin-3B C(17)-methyltransferase [Sulfolobus sp. A20-N-F8]TRM81146.1 precorrin-3B C(17)-methyltransferase [Sulfolobus sp. D5]TRM82855.1 precorrin-3B C(17)-methyltransferase [Sulfolobus sp. A20-N-F6]TRM89376.1 precorrin-3B C(17)-methyltransferase [Sulfolobus sp. C3]TRN01144.1 precorrin-3B C(17)-methyltransferase [Sulfolobus sp. E1]